MKRNPFVDVTDVLTQKDKYRLVIPIEWIPQHKFLRLLYTLKRILKLNNNWVFIVPPAAVGTMYRLSAQSNLLPDEIKPAHFFDISSSCIIDYMDSIKYCAAAAIQNSQKEPSGDLLDVINFNFDCNDLLSVLYPVLDNSVIVSVNEFYGMFDEKRTNTKDKDKTSKEKRLNAAPHSYIGSALHYFKGSMSESEIKWTLTWENLMMYLACIPSSNTEEKKPTIESKDAADLF